MFTRRSSPASRKGQALIEFTLALPVLLLILLAAYFVGAAMYTGANASTAVRTALENKYAYADSEQAISDLKTAVNGYNLGSFNAGGDNVDALTIANINNTTPIIVARKSVKFPLFPTFNFIITQGIPGDLLRNNVDPFTLATAVPYNTAVPQAAGAIDPAAFQWVVSTVPQFVPVNDECAPDLSVFAGSVNTCTDAGCEGLNAAALVQDHVNQGFMPVNACSTGAFKDSTNDVTFDSTPPAY